MIQRVLALDSQTYEDGKKAGLQDAELLTHAGLCPVCQLFGATGWRRRFRLSINAVGYHLFDDAKAAKVDGAKDKTIVPNLQDFHFYRVQFRPRQPNWWTEIDGIRQVSRQHWTTLNALAHHGAVPVSPVIKNFWRFEQRWPSRSVSAWLFGKLERNERFQSRISVGWAVRQPDTSWVIAGWAWLPQDDNLYHVAEAHHQTDSFLRRIAKDLQQVFSLPNEPYVSFEVIRDQERREHGQVQCTRNPLGGLKRHAGKLDSDKLQYICTPTNRSAYVLVSVPIPCYDNPHPIQDFRNEQ